MRPLLRQSHPQLFTRNEPLTPEVVAGLYRLLATTPRLKRTYRDPESGQRYVRLALPSGVLTSYFSFVRVDNHIFALGETLGQGSFGKAVVGYDIARREPVAVKIQRGDPTMLDRVAHQVTMSRGFGIGEMGPVLGPLYCQTKKGLKSYMVLPLATDALDTWVLRTEDIPRRTLVPVMQKVVEQLDTLHRNGYVHFDLKPDNIFIFARDGSIKGCLADFGISCEIGSPIPRLTGSHRQYVHMAPELFSHHVVANPALDLWGLGFIFAWLSRRVPSVEAVFRAIGASLQATHPFARLSLNHVARALHLMARM